VVPASRPVQAQVAAVPRPAAGGDAHRRAGQWINKRLASRIRAAVRQRNG